MRRDALVHVALHARQRDLDELVRLVVGARDALDGVAADAAEHRVLLLVGAREAREPFAVRHLRGEVFGLAQLEVELRRLLRGDVDGDRFVEVEADRANLDRVLAGPDLGGREAVAPLGIAHDRDGDVRAGLLGGDQHALHRAFLRRRDLPRQGLRGGGEGGKDRQHQAGRDRSECGCHGFPSRFKVLHLRRTLIASISPFIVRGFNPVAELSG